MGEGGGRRYEVPKLEVASLALLYAPRDKHRRPQKAACQRVGNTVMLISIGILTPLVCLSVLLLHPLSLVPLLLISSHSVLTLFFSQARNSLSSNQLYGTQ